MLRSLRFLIALLPAGLLFLSGCQANQKSGSDPGTPNPEVVLQERSVTPGLVKTLPGFEDLKLYPLLSSDDRLSQSPDFIFGAQPDGAALLPNPNGEGYVLITNHEVLRAVSRVYLDKTFKPVRGEYIVDGEGGVWRLCSATLATPAEHGFGPVYLTAGESDPEGMVHAINPVGAADKKNKTRTLPALGKASLENAVPLPKDAFPGKTVVLLTEDDADGQLMMYVSSTVGDLQNGKLYCLRQTSGNPVETALQPGRNFDVEFVEIAGARTLTGAQIAAQTKEKKAIQFARLEDLDYRKGSADAGREVFFAVTGAFEPDRVRWGRVYHLILNADNPLKGSLAVLADGATDPGNSLINPDNICATRDHVYIQEDGDAAPATPKHDGRIWQYSIRTRQLKPMLEMNHRRGDADFAKKYNPIGNQSMSSWEFGAMLDISGIIGVPNTFLVNIHAHTWRDMKFSNADGSSVSKATGISDPSTGSFAEGGQVILVQGVQD